MKRGARNWAVCIFALALSANGPKPPTEATVAALRAAGSGLPAEDGRDAEFAARGFIGGLSDPVIRNARGQAVWNAAAYDWVAGSPPPSVHPALWREMTLLRRHGLFRVGDGIWQVRGFDIANMTVIAGNSGWIIVDPLTSRETAAAAMELVRRHLGERPVRAVIYSHSHADHFGGVRGVTSGGDAEAGRVAILAPARFIEEAVSENVMAGAAMGRRASYQFGAGLRPGPQGQMGSGIGMAASGGEVTLITPTDTISRTGEARTIDGVELQFQIVSGSEAPAELNLYIPSRRTFLSAEMSTCSLHNILTPRGAKVRDAHLWAGFLDEALRLYADRSDVVISSHCWPRFGRDEVRAMLAAQRDNYRYLHDQTVRLLNRGETATEIAEALVQPRVLASEWYNRGFYGTFGHNSKAIYQYYLGWYDGNPVNLHALPPRDRARRYVAAMGGPGRVLKRARKSFAAGDYRWTSELLGQLVFADPENRAARELLADSLEQQGYQSESAIWRNQFLSAALELRGNAIVAATSTQSADVIKAVPTQLLLDAIATRYEPARLGRKRAAINIEITDRKESAVIEAGEAVLIGRLGPPAAQADATIRATRDLLLALLMLKRPLAQLRDAGLVVEGNADAVTALQDAIDPMPPPFNIVEP